MIPSINRSALMIYHTEAYLDWAQSTDGQRPLSAEGNVYLIAELETGDREEVRRQLATCWRRIAEEEFDAWWTDETAWPELRTIRDFEKYFRWEYREMVCDVLDTPVEHDDEEGEDEGLDFDPALN